MTLTFDEQTHTYYLDNKVIPSVTQILSLANTYNGVSKTLLERNARFGTAVHKATELHDLGILNCRTLDKALLPYLESWQKFLIETHFEIIGIEEQVYSKMGYAGTLDRIGILDGKLTLLDIKTSATVAKTTCLQLAAYAKAWEELKNNKVEKLICVQLKPDNYSITQYQNTADFLTFYNFLQVYKWSNQT